MTYTYLLPIVLFESRTLSELGVYYIKLKKKIEIL